MPADLRLRARTTSPSIAPWLLLPAFLLAGCKGDTSTSVTSAKAFRIEGLAWNDLDCNGVSDDDQGLANVVLQLVRAKDQALIGAAISADNGTWSIDNVPKGNYELSVRGTPAGYLPTSCGGAPPGPGDECPVIEVNGEGSYDFGFSLHAAQIGDFVWHDKDCDGVQGGADSGIPGLSVRLLRDGALVDQTETQGDGSYLFMGLCGGTYIVEVDTPGGLVPTFENMANEEEDSERSPATVTLQSGALGDSDYSTDFGFRSECCDGDLTLGDFVWNDLDCDGIQDPGEPGLENVVVRLEQGGVPFLQDETDEDGRYEFTGLCAGEYVVIVDPASLPVDFHATECDAGGNDDLDSECSPVEVVLGEVDDLSIDFGYHSSCCGGYSVIGDFVWDDLDRDGVQDIGEPGIEHVRLRLRDPVGTAFGVAETNGAGHYSFGSLCAGTYWVTIDADTLPAGYEPSECNIGDDTLDNDCSPVEVVLTSEDQVDDTVDFGFRAACYGGSGKIGDFVWNDLDCDGIQEPGEPGLQDVGVKLYSAGGEPLHETFTGANGDYSFEGLCAGTYLVVVDAATLPADFVPTPCGTTDPESDSNCDNAVTLPTDQSVDLTIDFGFHSYCCSGTASIGDRVWNDRNCDGYQDPNEPGLANIVLTLSKDGVPYGTAKTNSRGAYSFDKLCAGTYLVDIEPKSLPPGFVASDCEQAPSDTDSNCLPATVVLDDGTQDETVDFGFHGCCYGTAGVGDRTWLDEDGDGCFDDEEEGIGGIIVRVYDEYGTLVDEQTTPDYGRWKVFGLCPGTYTVEAYAPPELNLAPTICEACGDHEKDSNCTPATVVLVVDTIDFSVDFGFVEIAGSDGCSAGYWKQPPHFDSWPAPYVPEMQFGAVLEDALPGKTLLEVLQQQSDDSPLSSLARQAVAALLNAQAPAVEFGMTAEQVVSLFDAAFPGGDHEYEELKDLLEELNTRHCPLD